MPNRQDLIYVGAVIAVSFAMNYAWELAQLRFYANTGGLSAMWRHCMGSSIVDALLVLMILSIGRLIFAEWNWFSHVGIGRYFFVLMVGAVVGISVEWIGLRLLHRWEYDESMPIIPLFGVGIVPVTQMILLPSASYWLAQRTRLFAVRG